MANSYTGPVKVAILCGGQGTRIRDVADNIPKPMLEVGGLPILVHIMRWYASFGHRDFVLCLGHRGLAIRDYFLDFRTRTNDFTIRLGRPDAIRYHGTLPEADWSVTLADTGEKAMTGTRLFRARRFLAGEKVFALTYGDGVGDVDLRALLAFHKKHGRAMTVTGVRPPGRFGELKAGPGGRITEFNEKPQASGGLISGGFFLCTQKVFDYVSDDESLALETAPMRRLAADGQLMVYEHPGFWQPMDTYREYVLLNDLWSRGEAPWAPRR